MPRGDRPRRATPPGLRHILLAVVILIVAWMGYSIGVDRQFWGAWKKPSTGNQLDPGSAVSGTPRIPATPIAVPPPTRQ